MQQDFFKTDLNNKKSYIYGIKIQEINKNIDIKIKKF